MGKSRRSKCTVSARANGRIHVSRTAENRWSVGKKFFETFGVQIDTVYGETIGKLEKERLLIKEKGQIRLTERGVDISNYVMSEFLF